MKKSAHKAKTIKDLNNLEMNKEMKATYCDSSIDYGTVYLPTFSNLGMRITAIYCADINEIRENKYLNISFEHRLAISEEKTKEESMDGHMLVRGHYINGKMYWRVHPPLPTNIPNNWQYTWNDLKILGWEMKDKHKVIVNIECPQINNTEATPINKTQKNITYFALVWFSWCDIYTRMYTPLCINYFITTQWTYVWKIEGKEIDQEYISKRPNCLICSRIYKIY